MKKAILGAFVGALVYFVWGFVSWVVLPRHNATIGTLPNETLITDTLKTVLKQPGFYAFPRDMHNPSPSQADGNLAWAERYRSGPIGGIAFSPVGREPHSGGVYAAQFLSGFLLSGLVLLVLTAARKSWVSVGCRAATAAVVGLCAGVAAHVQNAVWFSFPLDFTLVNVLDLAVGFALMGAVLAKFVPEE